MIKAICLILALLDSPMVCPVNLETKKFKTPIEEIELKQVLQETHLEVFGQPASKNKINMAWAQIAFENGRGKLLYNYNLGNIGAHATKSTVPYYRVADSRFRSFFSFKEGATIYWQTLKNRCPGSLLYFNLGDARNSSVQLKNCRYYTADLEAYFLSLNSLFSESSRNR